MKWPHHTSLWPPGKRADDRFSKGCGGDPTCPRPGSQTLQRFTQWRRGESNRPAEDGGGSGSKLYRDLSWGGQPPTTLHYRQLVPEGQPRASASKPDDRAHSAHLSPSQPRPERDGRTVATV